MDRYRLLLLVIALVLAPLTTFRLYGADEIQYFAYLRSAVFDRDLDFANEYRWFADRDPEAYAGFRVTFLETKTLAGRAPNNAPIGCALLWSPFYLAALALERVSGAPASEPPGYSRLAIGSICLASMVYGVLGLLLTNEICRSFARPGAAFASTILVWFATNLLFYMYVTPPMSHASSFFATALFLWWWLRRREGFGRSFVLGLLGGLVASVRWQDGLFLVVPVAAPLLSGRVRSREEARRWLGESVATGLGALVAFLPQMLVWIHLNGSLTPLGVVALEGRLSPWAPYFFGVLFSPFHGLLVWSPILLPAFIGLGLLAARDGRGRALALGVVLQVWLLSGYVVAFGHGFGQRLFVSSLPAAAVGLAVFGARIALLWPRPVWVAAGSLAVVWNLGLVVQHGTGMIPRNRGVSFTTLLHNQLVEVPRIVPAVAAKYLFARQTLYRVDPLRERKPGTEAETVGAR